MNDTVPYEGHYEKLAERLKMLKFPRGSSRSTNYIWEAYEGAWLEVEAERVRDLWLSGWSCLARKVMG